MKYEKPERGNPHGLTINQHVFPVASIKRFCGTDGRVTVLDFARGKMRKAKPNDPLFVASRAWDQRAENLFRGPEDKFQRLADAIAKDRALILSDDDQTTVSYFFALWRLRAENRVNAEQFVELKGIVAGPSRFTKLEREELEKTGIVTSMGNEVPTRHFTGLHIQRRAAEYSRDINARHRWQIYASQNVEILIPDQPEELFVPILPDLILAPTVVGAASDVYFLGLNNQVITKSQGYMFARTIAACMDLPFPS